MTSWESLSSLVTSLTLVNGLVFLSEEIHATGLQIAFHN